MRRRSSLVFVLALLLAGCADQGSIRLSIFQDAVDENLPLHYMRGDSVQLFATEWGDAPDPAAPSSNRSPSLYTWSTSTPDIVEIATPGLLVMKNSGRAELNVRTSRASRSVWFWVYPPDAAIRLAPRDPTLNVGHSLFVTSTVVDGAGVELQSAPENQATLILPFTLGSPQVLTPRPGPAHPVLGREVIALRSGQAFIIGRLEVYRDRMLRGSILVTVR